MANNILAMRRYIEIYACNILQQTGTTTSVPDIMLNNIWAISIAHNNSAFAIGMITSMPYFVLNNIRATRLATNILAARSQKHLHECNNICTKKKAINILA